MVLSANDPAHSSRCLIELEGRGAAHMGWDAALFEIAEGGPAGAVLRLYTWNPSAISLGRFQDCARAIDRDRAAAAGIEIVRRPTGGRAVLHEADVTYALIARHDDPVFGGPRLASRRAIGEALATGLRLLGVEADRAPRDSARESVAGERDAIASHAAPARPAPARRGVPPCFSSAAREELSVRGRKLLGSARVEGRRAFLQHGSLPIALGPAAIASYLPGGAAARAAAGARLAALATCLADAAGKTIAVESTCDAIRRGFEARAQREFRVAAPEPRERALAERRAAEFAVSPIECRVAAASVR